MDIKRLFFVFVLALVAAGCGGGGEEDVAATTVPLTVPSTSSTSSTTTTTTTTTTEAPETTSPVEDEVEAADTLAFELTWADEGTVEADVEQAFWRANTSRRQAVENQDQTTNAEFLNSHTGRELARLLEAQQLDAQENHTYLYPEPTQSLIEFIVPVTDSEVLMQVCELDRAEFYINGELNDDRVYESQFQARFVLGDDGVWRWEERIKLIFEPLEEGDVPWCILESQS